MSAKCQKRTLLPLDIWQLEGCIEDQLRSTNQKTFLDGMLRFVTAITGWIFLPVGCFFRHAAFDCSLAATSFFRVHGTMGAKRRRQSRMQFAPSHGRSLRPRGVGAERSSYSCSSIYCLQPFRLKARSGWPLSLSKHIMTRSGPLRQPAQRLLRWNQSHP